MNKLYRLLYYIASLITIVFCIIAITKSIENLSTVLIIISILTFLTSLVFTIAHRKNTTDKKEIILPIAYLGFVIIITICAYIYNIDAIVSYIHFSYYASLMLVAYIGLNIYTLLLFLRRKK